jgi:segregation and condensation protein A
MIEHNIQVKLDHFDGPLGLLLHLVQKEQMNIKDLEINRITEQYIDYLQKMQDLNFDVAGEYLYMAASLLFIKSKSVAEDEEQKIRTSENINLEITTKTQLIQKLEELQKFQRLGEKLMGLPKRDEDIFVRPKVDRKAIQNSILTPMSLESITEVMIDMIRKEKRKYTVVKRDKLSIKEKLRELKSNLKKGSKTVMSKLVNTEEKSIEEIVITFISLLELARLQKLDVFQNEAWGEIYVEVRESLDDFDVETANGFDPEEEKEQIKTEDIASAQKSLPKATEQSAEQVVQ